jgi:hypothetical protein
MNAKRVLFGAGDCTAGALVGVATALAVRAVVPAGADMVGAMMVGMVIGTLVHLVVGIALTPLLGMFETMVPGMFIGMYGGMFFAMRDSMQAVGIATAVSVGAVFGVAVTLGIAFWNIQLRHLTNAEFRLPLGGHEPGA